MRKSVGAMTGMISKKQRMDNNIGYYPNIYSKNPCSITGKMKKVTYACSNIQCSNCKVLMPAAGKPQYTNPLKVLQIRIKICRELGRDDEELNSKLD